MAVFLTMECVGTCFTSLFVALESRMCPFKPERGHSHLSRTLQDTYSLWLIQLQSLSSSHDSLFFVQIQPTLNGQACN